MNTQPDFAAALDRCDRASALAATVIAAITPDRYDAPTPCADWSVRNLLSHLTGGTYASAEWVRNGEMPGHRDAGHVMPDDPAAEYREGARLLRDAFAEPGVPERTYKTPMGEMPGVFLVELRFNETLMHAWDLARATGQSTAFDADLVAASRAFFERAPRFEGGPFAAPREAPESATAADRLAAFAGREVT